MFKQYGRHMSAPVMMREGEGVGTPAPAPAPAPTPSPAPAPAPAAAEWHSSFEGETKGWLENRGMLKLSSQDALTQAINGHRAAEAKLGVPAERLLKLPDQITAESMAPVYDRLGRPKEASGYELKVAQDADTAQVDAVKSLFHKHGFTKAQGEAFFQDVVAAENAKITAAEAAENERAKTDVGALKAEWGKGYDANLETADRGAVELAKRAGLTDETVQKLRSVIGESALAKMFFQVGLGLKEDTFVNSDITSRPGALTKEAALAKIAQLKMDPEFAKKRFANDAETVQMWKNLHIVASGS